MAELRESFPTLENVATQEGVAFGARVEGNAAAGVQGAIGFSFKDAAGNVVLPTLDAAGRLPIALDAAGNGKRARGQNSSGSASQVTIATMTLVANKRYENIHVLVSCYRDATYQLIWNNNGTEEVLADLRVGPGHFTTSIDLGDMEIQAGATGTQQFLLKAINENALSALSGTVSCKELSI